MHIGEAYNFSFGRVKFTIVHHGAGIADKGEAGNPCGFIVTMDKRKIVFPSYSP